MLILFFVMAPILGTLPTYALFLLGELMQAFVFFMLTMFYIRARWKPPNTRNLWRGPERRAYAASAARICREWSLRPNHTTVQGECLMRKILMIALNTWS